MDDRIKEGGAYPEVGRLFSENATCGDYIDTTKPSIDSWKPITNNFFSIDGFTGDLYDMNGKIYAKKCTYWERSDNDSIHFKVIDRYGRIS